MISSNRIRPSQTFDVVVAGATPAGIAAALACARQGRRVALVEYHAHVGGMATSGLGKSDIEHRELIGGIFGEFIQRVRRHYATTFGLDSPDYARCKEGYYYEPSVAEMVFEQLLADAGESICILREQLLTAVEVVDNRVTRVNLRGRENLRELVIQAQVFIDATYEGDLYALAGAAFRLGREGRTEFAEPHAGTVYFDYEANQFLPGTTGQGDNRLPAYTYRLCLTTEPCNYHRLLAPPLGYNRNIYLPYHEDLQAGRLSAPKRLMEGWGYYPEHFDTLLRALSVTEIPNHKIDANINPRPLAFPFAGQNAGYVEGSWKTRKQICLKHRQITLGLLYFLQHDPSIPHDQQEMARQYQLPADEFIDNDHFPYQLYVREARRLRGRYTLTEHDVTNLSSAPEAGQHYDAIAMGEFPIDSFPVQARQPADKRVLEGYLGMLDEITRPYQIPYRIMLPERICGLLVPVAASTTHVAYSSIRMEPTWMAMGQAAGVAAHLAIENGCECHHVSIAELQKLLVDQGQILDLKQAAPVADRI